MFDKYLIQGKRYDAWQIGLVLAQAMNMESFYWITPLRAKDVRNILLIGFFFFGLFVCLCVRFGFVLSVFFVLFFCPHLLCCVWLQVSVNTLQMSNNFNKEWRKNCCTLVLITLQLKYHIIQEMPKFNAAHVQSILLLSSVLKVATSIPEHLLPSSMVIIYVLIYISSQSWFP